MNNLDYKQAARLKFERRKKDERGKKKFKGHRSQPYERNDSWKKQLDRDQ